MKFENEDKQYKKQREIFSKKINKKNFWEIVDHWSLYCGISNLARKVAIYELLKSTLSVPGHVAEFGTWKGTNLLFMAKLIKIFDPYGNKLVYGFDSFEGLDKPTSKKDNYGKKMVNTYRGSYQELKEVIRLYGLDDDIVITKGNIVNTLPKFLKNNNSMFSFVYCDTDSYAPTKTILENLHSRMPVNGIFVFDEYNYEQWGGETKAVNEFLDKFGAHYEVNNITNTRQPTMYLKKQSPHLH